MLKKKLIALLTLMLFLSSMLSHSTDLPSEIKMLSWNVLHDSKLITSRAQTVLAVLAQSQADVLLLQEVNPAFVKMLKQEPRFSQYGIYYLQQNKKIAGGLAILSRLPLKTSQKYQRLPSRMGRGLLYLMLENKQQWLCIANVHLESMMDDTQIRIKQLKAIFEQLNFCDDIFLAGDFNFGKNEAEEVILAVSFKDAWLQLRANQSGLTFNREVNERSDDNAFLFEKSRRLDRIYLNSECFKAKHIELSANQPDEKGNMPSDHFAVLAIFSHCAEAAQ